MPLSYVAEKLDSAIEALHTYAQRHLKARDGLLTRMHYLLVAHPGLHSMVGKANDRSLATRLLNGNGNDLQTWLRLIERGAE